MDLLGKLFGLIVDVLLVSWIILKINNLVLAHRLNCRSKYKEILKEVKKRKISKILLIVSIASMIILIVMFIRFLFNSLANISAVGIMSFLTLGGTYYVDTGNNPEQFNNLINSISYYFNSFTFVIIIFYITLYVVFSRGLYINFKVYSILKGNKDK